MKLFAYHLRKKLWLFPAMGGYVIFAFFLQTRRNFLDYHESAEVFMSLWVALFSALVLTSDAEKEFALCYDVPLWRLGFSQWIPHLLYPFVTAVMSCPLYFLFHGLEEPSERAFSSSYTKYAVLFFSFFVTFFFFSALILFLRVLCGSLYVSFSALALFYYPCYQLQRALFLGNISVSSAKYHVWITGFLWEDRFAVTREMWLINRYAYLVAACVLTFLAFLILKQKYDKP